MPFADPMVTQIKCVRSVHLLDPRGKSSHGRLGGVASGWHNSMIIFIITVLTAKRF